MKYRTYRTFTQLFFVACLGLIAADGYGQQWQIPQQIPQQSGSTDRIQGPGGWTQTQQPMPQQPMPQMQQMPPGPLDGMWMANNGVSAMFQSNFYVIAANGQAMEGGTYMISGNEMITQVMQGQGAGQQTRYNFQPGPDGRSFTLTMQNGSGSITYQKMGDLPQQPYPQAVPQQMPPQPFPQPTPQQYPQPMPPQPYPQMQQTPQQW
ncbi:hypothetical protein AGMMS50256_34080 [Betaproteobacteria bacterium]|nr:hypothetical protein AGMMS50256_34080 [Betaproteobacteria bacterium]